MNDSQQFPITWWIDGSGTCVISESVLKKFKKKKFSKNHFGQLMTQNWEWRRECIHRSRYDNQYLVSRFSFGLLFLLITARTKQNDTSVLRGTVKSIAFELHTKHSEAIFFATLVLLHHSSGNIGQSILSLTVTLLEARNFSNQISDKLILYDF